MRATLLTIAALLTGITLSPQIAAAQSYTISTFAGGALPVNLTATSASLYGPQSALAIDGGGNVFFADGNTILRLDATSGLLTLVAGTGTPGYTGDNGAAVSAQLHSPYGVAIDAAGNIYIASYFDNVVREISGGVITTIAGNGTAGFSGDNGPATSAQLNAPYGIAVDSSGNLYIADYGNNRIREVSGGIITTIAGNGSGGFSGDNGLAPNAQINSPRGLTVDTSGNIYIADTGNSRIRKVTAGTISTVAGTGTPGFTGDNGPAISAQLNVPCGVALDVAGNLLIADYYNNRVRKVAGGIISTVAGRGTQGFSGDSGSALTAQLNNPFVVAVDSGGNLYIGDYGNNRIREVSAGVITTVAGNGTSGFSGDGGAAVNAQLNSPSTIAISSSGNVYFADTLNNRVREVTGGVIMTVAGNGTAGFSGDTGGATAAQLSQPSSIALDSSGNLYIADTGNNRIRKVTGGNITTVAGNGTAGFAGDSGPAVAAELNQPAGVALDSSGNLYIADSVNNRIRKVTGTTITTVAGNGTPGFSGDGTSATSAQLNNPEAVAVDSTGHIFIADSTNNRVRKVTTGTITTIVGNGTSGFSGDNAAATAAQLFAPGGVSVTANGNLYISDTSNNRIRQVTGGTITTIAGGGATFSDGGASTGSDLGSPQGIALDSTGNIYIADTADNRIRLLTPLPLSVASPGALPNATAGTVYSPVTFTAAGGAGGYTWTATGLPAGLTFSTAGVLSGTPTTAATATPRFTVKDSALTTASASLSLTIAGPVPTVTTLSPQAATANGAAFTLTVNGTGFVTGSAIQWNGTSVTTRLVSSTQLTASIAATLIANSGSAAITVLSGGNVSNSTTFPINAPTPTLTSVSPNSAVAGNSGVTVTGTGTGFVQATQLEWNGAALTTTYVSAIKVTATIPANLLATAGTAPIVANSGGTSSAPVTFTITAPPSLTSTSPTSTTAYGPTFTLTVTGTGFATGATIQWNNSPLVTKFVSATQLTAPVPSATIGGAGTVNVVVTSGGVSTAAISFTVNPPPPAITTLSPASAIATGAALTLTVNGTGFTQSATVEWSNAALPTTFVSATQLNAYVSASQIATAGNASVLVNQGGTSSAAVTFTITAPPAITTLNPAAAVAGNSSFNLTVTGTGFVSGAQVQWNGAPLNTTFVSATQLTASVSAALIASTGSVTILVYESGASSAGSTFAINGPPALTSISPTSAAVGGAAFTLTVNGTGFVSGSAIAWNGTALTTKFVSTTQLTAPITASMIASAGSATVGVNAGGFSTSSLTLSINAPPAISSLSPASVPGTGQAFTLTVTGTGFVSGSTVQWNGTALTTTYISATQLTAAVPANLAAGSGTASVTVINPGPTTSTAYKLAITATKPAVTTGGVVPLFSSTSVVQAGSWISIYGTALANGTYTWKGDYPTSLGGTSVKIDNKSAYLWYVSPTQINLQVPNDTTTGSVNVVVTTSAGTVTSTVTLAPYGPSLSQFPLNYAAGVILTPDGSGAYGGGTYDLAGPSGVFSFNTRPARAGETIELFGVGFGATSPTVAAGKAFTGAAPTVNPVTVTIGGVSAQVLFAGLTASGVYQINLVMPSVASGDEALVASVAGVQTPANVLLTIQ